MVKNKERLYELAMLYIANNKLQIGYPNTQAKLMGRNRIILLNGVRVTKKQLGLIAFAALSDMGELNCNWGEMCSDLASQIIISARD